MASFKNVLTDVLGKEIPIDLARAIFRLDLFNVMKYCPILDGGLQDKYDELLNERSAQHESNGIRRNSRKFVSKRNDKLVAIFTKCILTWNLGLGTSMEHILTKFSTDD